MPLPKEVEEALESCDAAWMSCVCEALNHGCTDFDGPARVELKLARQLARTAIERAIAGAVKQWRDLVERMEPMLRVGSAALREEMDDARRDARALLDAAIARLGTDVDPNYWKATEGNARAALVNMRRLAELAPDGVWDGD